MVETLKQKVFGKPKVQKCLGTLCSECVCVCYPVFTTQWTITLQPPLSREFSRQEYWSGLPFPSPGDLPNPGIEPGSASLKVDSSPFESPGKIHQGRASFRHPIYNKLNVACLQTWQCLCALCPMCIPVRISCVYIHAYSNP